MPAGLKHRYGQHHLHFITFSCYRRLPLLEEVESRNLFVKILGEVRDRYDFAVVGYVVMPEHVHMLISESPKATPSTVLQVLKQRVSHCLRQERKAPAGQSKLHLERGEGALRPLWEPRFYDFNVWSQKKKVEKLHYMDMNPVKRELVAHPKDWAWSSFSFYAGKDSGLVRIDPMS